MFPEGFQRLPDEYAEQWHSDQAPKFEQRMKMCLDRRVAEQDAIAAEARLQGMKEGSAFVFRVLANLVLTIALLSLSTWVVTSLVNVLALTVFTGIAIGAFATWRLKILVAAFLVHINVQRDAIEKSTVLDAAYEKLVLEDERNIRITEQPIPEAPKLQADPPKKNGSPTAAA